MAHPNFDDDIRPIFKHYVDHMLQVELSDDEGTAPLDLSNYDSVKRFNLAIQVAIHGYEIDSTAPHPMPEGGKSLRAEDICTFDDWITNGMPQSDDSGQIA